MSALEVRMKKQVSSKVPGTLIAFEGLQGSGKSTQIRLLYRWLQGEGCRVFLSAWETSELVLGARRRGRKQHLFTPLTFSLLSATDFADRHDRQILPMLKAGFIVLCDRYTFSSFATDRVRGCDPGWLRELYVFAHPPDITFLMDLPLHLALGRIAEERQQLEWFEAGMDLGLSNDISESLRLFQGRILEEYQKMLPTEHFDVMDASQEIHQIQMELRRVVTDRVDLGAYRQEGRR